MTCLNPFCETPTTEVLCDKDWKRLHPVLVSAYLEAMTQGNTRDVEQRIFRYFASLERFKGLAS